MSLDEDRSRVRQRHAALVLGLFRRLVVSVALIRNALLALLAQHHPTNPCPNCWNTSTPAPTATSTSSNRDHAT